MARKAFIVWGGWDGHQPKEVAEIYNKMLKEEGFETQVADSLEPFADVERMKTFDLIVPCWTCGQITQPQSEASSRPRSTSSPKNDLLQDRRRSSYPRAAQTQPRRSNVKHGSLRTRSAVWPSEL